MTKANFFKVIIEESESEIYSERHVWFIVSGILVSGEPVSKRRFFQKMAETSTYIVDGKEVTLAEFPAVYEKIKNIQPQENPNLEEVKLINVKIFSGDLQIEIPHATIEVSQISAWGDGGLENRHRPITSNR